MNPNDPIQAQARQALAGAQGGQPPMPPQSTPSQSNGLVQKPSGLPTPPPQVAMKLAHIALTLDPMVLGTLLWRALKQHGAAINAQSINDLGGGGQPQLPPQGVPQGMPPMQ